MSSQWLAIQTGISLWHPTQHPLIRAVDFELNCGVLNPYVEHSLGHGSSHYYTSVADCHRGFVFEQTDIPLTVEQIAYVQNMTTWGLWDPARGPHLNSEVIENTNGEVAVRCEGGCRRWYIGDDTYRLLSVDVFDCKWRPSSKPRSAMTGYGLINPYGDLVEPGIRCGSERVQCRHRDAVMLATSMFGRPTCILQLQRSHCYHLRCPWVLGTSLYRTIRWDAPNKNHSDVDRSAILFYLNNPTERRRIVAIPCETFQLGNMLDPTDAVETLHHHARYGTITSSLD